MTVFPNSVPGAIQSCIANAALCEEMARQLAQMDEAAKYAPLSQDVYAINDDNLNDPPPPAGWTRKGQDHDKMRELLQRDMTDGQIDNMFAPKGSTYRAMLYENTETGELALSYRGTQTGKDWLENGRQGLGLQSDHYRRAMDLGEQIDLAAEMNGQDLSITGHSLGGGMASAASVVTGRKAVTFNAAGVHPDTVPDYDLAGARKNITSYVVDGEALNHRVQDNRDIIRGAASYGAGAAGQAVAGPLGGRAAALGTRYALRDAIPENAGRRVALPDTTTRPSRAWYDPRQVSDAAMDWAGIEQHGMAAVADGIVANRADLEAQMAAAGC